MIDEQSKYKEPSKCRINTQKDRKAKRDASPILPSEDNYGLSEYDP